MWYPCKLVLKNYIPLSIERGMYFRTLDGEGVWQLDKKVTDPLTFFALYGFPVEIHIMDENVELASPENIKYIAERVVDSDEYGKNIWEITEDDINYILSEDEGNVLVEIKDEGENVVPLYDEENKVMLMFI